MASPPHARFYTRDNCSLCERAYPILQKLAREGLLTVSRIDISDDATLQVRYATRIPVVELEGGATFAGRISEYRLRKAVRALAAAE